MINKTSILAIKEGINLSFLSAIRLLSTYLLFSVGFLLEEEVKTPLLTELGVSYKNLSIGELIFRKK